MKETLRRYRTFIFVFILVAAFYIPLPYNLELPGTVEKLSPMVSVEGGVKIEKGSLNLVTIYSLNTNIYMFIYGVFAPNTLVNKQAAADEENELEMTHMMDNSKIDAITSAFNASGIPVDSRKTGVFISGFLSNSNAKGILRAGDIIQSLDGFSVFTPADFNLYLNQYKHAGESVTVSFLRNGKEKKATVKVIELDPYTHEAGLGIISDNELEIKTPNRVTIKTNDISGPSAGLMISLEIFEQVNKVDLTKGYKVAGTGTIDLDGNVGQIGGIRQKITAAHNAGVDIFFCPKDLQEGDDNEKDVMDEAKKRGYHIRIVPVSSLLEAIACLEKLHPKKISA